MRDRPTDFDPASSERPARILAFLFIALAPCPLLGSLLLPDPRRTATHLQIAELTLLFAATALLFSRMRWRSTDPRLVIGVPGVCLLALLGTIAIMGVRPDPNDGATYLVGSILIPVSVGLTQRRGHATVAAGLTVLGVIAIANARSHVHLDEVVAFTAFAASAVAGETVAQGRHRQRTALQGLSQLAVSTQRLAATESRSEALDLAVAAARELTRADAAAITGDRDAGPDVLATSPPLDIWPPVQRAALLESTIDPAWTRSIGTGTLAVVGGRAHDGRLRLDVLSQTLAEHLIRLELVERLQREAMSDALTGIGNRRAAMQQLARVEPGDAVVLIDLDHFKHVNDAHGHDAGDLELQALGRFLADEVRAADRVFRFGGEEFLMLLETGDSEAFVRRIQTSWAQRRQLTTLSAGHAVHRAGTEPSSTLKRADLALYRAKDGGRNRVEFAA